VDICLAIAFFPVEDAIRVGFEMLGDLPESDDIRVAARKRRFGG
jgi:hypothetical protein